MAENNVIPGMTLGAVELPEPFWEYAIRRCKRAAQQTGSHDQFGGVGRIVDAQSHGRSILQLRIAFQFDVTGFEVGGGRCGTALPSMLCCL